MFGCVAGLLLMAVMAKCCCENQRGKYSTARATDEGALEFESELRPMYDEV